MQVRPYGLMAYDRVEYLTGRRKKHRHDQLAEKTSINANAFEIRAGQGQYEGLMTEGARKRLKRAIQLIVAISEPKTAMDFKTNKEFKFKLNFITLTLPCPQLNITDKQIKKEILDVWLKTAKRRFKLRSYIWRAERQKNGNLHFHLITDTYIRYDELRDTWNDKLNRLGFIDRFEKKHGHRHPNSTDVHAIKNVKNLAAYFSKYMAKGERTAEELYRVPWSRAKWHEKMIISPAVKFKRVLTREESRIDGKLWDCSKNLKYKQNCEMLIEAEAQLCLQRASQDPEVKQKNTDYCLMVFLSPSQFKKYVTGTVKSRYLEWLSVIKNVPDN